MNKEAKDLAYFQQQIAEKYGCVNWNNLLDECYSIRDSAPYFNEAAEAYSTHRYEQGKQEGEANVKSYLENRIKELKTSAEYENQKHNRESFIKLKFSIKELEKLSILNGLKED